MIFKTSSGSILLTILDDSNKINTSDATGWNFEKRPGMLYFVARAVSVGTNGNGDHFTEEELRKSYKTFVGKGLFVNHASNDIEKKRGMIVDAKWNDAGPAEKYVTCLCEFNEDAFPELGKMLRSGMLTDVSMGCNVQYSICSVCSNKAKTTAQYCEHVKMHKGGASFGKPVYEINHDIEFIELSLVSVGADPQAKILEVLARKKGLNYQELLQKAASSNDPFFVENLEQEMISLEKIAHNAIKKANELRKKGNKEC